MINFKTKYLDPDKPEIDANGKVISVPKGYKWCEECSALTPHDKEKFSSVCVVCGLSKYGSDCYPTCGWEPDEDHDQSPFEELITIHHEGCHCKIDRGSHPFSGSHAKIIAKKFYEDWMRNFPDRGSYALPEDNDWYIPHKKLKDQWIDASKIECGCPKVKIFRHLDTFNYKYGYGSGMDCSHDIWWSYNQRCPICGNILHISDSSC